MFTEKNLWPHPLIGSDGQLYDLRDLNFCNEHFSFSFFLCFLTAEWKLVIATLTRLYNEISAALGGSNANPSKKREIEDNSRKIGALFAKLNSGDISPNAAAKLVQLCQSLDAGDFAGALRIQVCLLHAKKLFLIVSTSFIQILKAYKLH